MHKITALIAKNNRVQVWVDEDYSFSCSENFVIKHSLYVGKEYDQNEFFQLKEAAIQDILRLKLFEYASKIRYSKKELFRKVNLYAKKRFNLEIDQKQFEESFNKIVESGIYNEKQIINNWIYVYLDRGKGKRYIESKLIFKGFQKDEIAPQLAKINQAQLNNRLKTFLEKKRELLKKKSKDEYDLRNRLIKAAMAKGYDYKDIKELL